MEQQSLTGIWVLKHRDEVYSDENLKKEIKDEPEEFIVPEKEILYFSENYDFLIQIGIRNRSEQEHTLLEPEMRYLVSYCFPGEYNLEDMKISTTESGTYQLKDKGLLYVSVYDEDYVCQEIWERMEEGVEELIDFIEFYISQDELP